MKDEFEIMKYFFWIAFAVFLAASIPHVAYFFASFEPSEGPEGIWWWAVSYAIAISIDVTVYLLSWTAFQRYRKYRTAKAVWQHWLLIIMCTVFSWVVNWAYAKQFHNAAMLSSAESVAPWLATVFPFMASAFPLLGIVYTMMAETISETSTGASKLDRLQTVSELTKQTQLPTAPHRRALTSGHRQNPASLVTTMTNRTTNEVSSEARNDTRQTITGQFVAVEDEPAEAIKEKSNPVLTAVSSTEGNPDKLQMTLEALRVNPDLTDEALATRLSLKRPASARFWRLKAIEILNADKEKNNSEPKVPAENAWAMAGTLANGSAAKR